MTKGDIDNSRYGNRSNHGDDRLSHSHQCFQLSQGWPHIDEFEIYLTTPPAQLEVIVFHDGQVVPFADVQLYWSLEDYESDVTPGTKITGQDLVYPGLLSIIRIITIAGFSTMMPMRRGWPILTILKVASTG